MLTRMLKLYGFYCLTQTGCALKPQRWVPYMPPWTEQQNIVPSHIALEYRGGMQASRFQQPSTIEIHDSQLLIDFYVTRALKQLNMLKRFTADTLHYPTLKADAKLAMIHGKCGTVLLSDILDMFAETMNEPIDRYGFPYRIVQCRSSAIQFYTDFMKGEMEVMKRDCPSGNGVHMVRDPVEIVISGYIYHLWSNDTYGLPTGPDKLQGKPLREGILIEAEAELITFQQIMDTLEGTLDNPRVVHLTLDDFEENFDNTTRTLFAKWLGPDDPRVDGLVQRATAFDINHWSEERRRENLHIADPEQVFEVTKALAELIQEASHPTIVKMLDYQKKLHFTGIL